MISEWLATPSVSRVQQRGKLIENTLCSSALRGLFTLSVSSFFLIAHSIESCTVNKRTQNDTVYNPKMFSCSLGVNESSRLMNLNHFRFFCPIPQFTAFLSPLTFGTMPGLAWFTFSFLWQGGRRYLEFVQFRAYPSIQTSRIRCAHWYSRPAAIILFSFQHTSRSEIT